MRFMNIASGSSGNATYVGTDHTHILIDSGISRKRISEGLKKLDLGLDDLNAILITHEHSDHVSSLDVMLRTRDIPVYTAAGTGRALIAKGSCLGDTQLLHTVQADQSFTIGDLEITGYRVSHDAAEPLCYRFSDGSASCAVVTDLGVYDDYLTERLQGLSALMIEANHDVRMLETGPYPYPLKLRVGGNGGHLSNEHAGKMLSGLLHDGIRYIALGHLSHQNNEPTLARMAVRNEIDEADNPYRADDFRIDIADRRIGTDIYQI